MSTDTASTTVAADQPNTPVSFPDADSRGDEMHDHLETWADELTELTDEAQASREFQKWLDVHARFHDYSYRNTLLIKAQKPDARKVAGFWTWQNEFDRHVQKGEDAIWIWAPIITDQCPNCGNSESYHDRDHVDCTNQETGDPDTWSEGVVGFKPTSVFDISQTEGEPLPELETATDAGDVDDPTKLREDLFKMSEEVGVDCNIIAPDDWTHGDARGVCAATSPYSCDPLVEVRDRENDADLCRTLLHEYAHARLHFQLDDDENPGERSKREVEAENVAYLVARHLGLDPENSKFYLATWQDDDADTIQRRLDRITTVASEFIDVLDRDC